MLDLRPFNFSDQFIEQIKRIRSIPVHFYNREGQILIYKKDNITDKEIKGLLKFRGRGIFFDNARNTLSLLIGSNAVISMKYFFV